MFSLCTGRPISIIPTITVYVSTIIIGNNIIWVRYVFRDCEIPVAPWFIILGLIEGYSPFQDWASLTRWIRRNCLTIYNLVVIQLSVLDLSTFCWLPTIKRSLSIFVNVFNISTFHRAILSTFLSCCSTASWLRLSGWSFCILVCFFSFIFWSLSLFLCCYSFFFCCYSFFFRCNCGCFFFFGSKLSYCLFETSNRCIYLILTSFCICQNLLSLFKRCV